MRNFSRTLTPERFDAKVAIRADGSYAYSYEGVLIFVPALALAGQGVIAESSQNRTLSRVE